jgi:uncharacterized cupin superfamily protein
MFEFSVAPQARVPASHFHREVDEVVYALDGVLTSTVDGKRHELRNGGSLSSRAAACTFTRTCMRNRRGCSAC